MSVHNIKYIKNLLCIRPDNFGDVLMSSPAIRAIKETFGCKITLLTSSMGSIAAPLVPEIDEVMVFDLPWIKIEEHKAQPAVLELIVKLSARKFDACIIFNTFSQSSLPSALIVWLAGIPLRIGYCRENPYHLLNCWLPDAEPYNGILHQVERDIELAKSIGTKVSTKDISIEIPAESKENVFYQMHKLGLKPGAFTAIHIGVSEEKRKYPLEKWVVLCQYLIDNYQMPLVLTGSKADKGEIAVLSSQLKGEVYDFSGVFSLAETASLIQNAQALISVNTGVVHLAAATKTPCVVLYAQTNPQHSPWMTSCKIMEFSVSEQLRSGNEVLKWVNQKYYNQYKDYPSPEDVAQALAELLKAQNFKINRINTPAKQVLIR